MSDLVTNRKALHDYEILETVEAGIVLVGTEVKSLREHHGSLTDAFVVFEDGEAILISSSITPYRFGNIHNHEERRKRKLLLHKKEIFSLRRQREEKGLTIVPLAFYLKKGNVKVRLAVVRGKKQHDKRAATKERDVKREIDRAMKG